MQNRTFHFSTQTFKIDKIYATNLKRLRQLPKRQRLAISEEDSILYTERELILQLLEQRAEDRRIQQQHHKDMENQQKLLLDRLGQLQEQLRQQHRQQEQQQQKLQNYQLELQQLRVKMEQLQQQQQQQQSPPPPPPPPQQQQHPQQQQQPPPPPQRQPPRQRVTRPARAERPGYVGKT
ncbi:protein FAM170B-like [Prorops nasuta]|uniref:protein FAM170B-like n=1 Tax=Prorops nasuta TaxID=863751 RepID=UPI0034CF19F2